MSESKIEALAQRSDQFCRDCSDCTTPGQSPIEATFAWAIGRVFEECGGGQMQDDDPQPFEDIHRELGYRSATFHAYVYAQVRIGKYTADFVLAYRTANGEILYAVIECDGHEFHERTKEQAEHDKRRDRELQEQGFAVLRVTGSEIWRSPIKTAFSVLMSAVKALGARS